MNTFHGNPQLKQRLEVRARMLETDFSNGLRNLRPGEHAWQVRQHMMPLVAMPESNAAPEDNNSYGSTIDVPAHVLFVQHALFEQMHHEQGLWWPLRFARALPVGADLSPVWREMALFVLADAKIGLPLYAQSSQQDAAMNAIIDLFESDSKDATAWEAAATVAFRAASINRNGGHGTSAKECMQAAGDSACRSAAYFAGAFKDARQAMEAISWAAWPLRHMAEHAYYSGGNSPMTRINEDDMVSVGHALWATAMERRDFSRAVEKGEELRYERYALFAGKLIELIKKQAPRTSMFSRVFSSRLFGYN